MAKTTYASAGDYGGAARRRLSEKVDIDAREPEEYLSVQQLAARISYRPQTIRNLMVRGIFQLDVHYFKPFGRPLFKWSSVVDLIEGARRGEAWRV